MNREALEALRAKAADEIDRLIAFLDQTDGYTSTELEEAGDPTDEEIMAAAFWPGILDDDEPSLGWVEDVSAHLDESGLHSSDIEVQCEDEGDISDSGIGDPDGLLEQLTGYRPVGGMGAAGFASHVE